MRYAFLSDVHANLEALTTALEDVRRRDISELYCLGDIVNYGADPAACVKQLKDTARVILRGNHETALTDEALALTFNAYAYEALVWTRRQLSAEDIHILTSLPLVFEAAQWTMVHATLDGPDTFDYLTNITQAAGSFACLGNFICFYGHTHIPILFTEGDAHPRLLREGRVQLQPGRKYIANAASVGQPRDGDPRLGYLLYDDESYNIELVRLTYDYKTSAKKIWDAGLPHFLGERLEFGR